MAEKEPDLFVIDPAPTFTHPVKISAPGGVVRELQVCYRHMGKSALRDWRASIAGRPSSEEPDVLMEIINGWENAAEAFSRDSLVRLMDNHYHAGEELVIGYLEGLTGARLGN